MQFVSLATTESDPQAAIDEIVARALASFQHPVHLASLFVSGAHIKHVEAIVEAVRDRVAPRVMIGSSGESVVGEGREVEGEAAITLMLAHLPGVTLLPIRIAASDWADLAASHHALLDALCVDSKTKAVIAMGDPWTVPVDHVLGVLNDHAAGVPLLGGLASGGTAAGQSRLIVDDQIFSDGLIGVSISGSVSVEPIVSQGCKPLWTPLVITRGRGNAIEQLGGKPALGVLRDLIESMGREQKQQLGNGLMLGAAVSEYRETFGLGDFVMRGIIGVEEEHQVIGVAEKMRVGQTVQFHVRDPQTAHEDLVAHLRASLAANGPAAGALLFTCNGRGCRMFEQGGHDVAEIRRVFPALPVTGFFAAGELGPVDGKNFIHGHTACVAMFRPVK